MLKKILKKVNDQTELSTPRKSRVKKGIVLPKENEKEDTVEYSVFAESTPAMESTESHVDLVSKQSPLIKKFDVVAKYTIYILMALLPIFFLPTSTLELGQVKLGLLVFAVTIASISLALSAFYKKQMRMVSKKVWIPILSVSVLTLLSSFFSSSYKDGFLGSGMELDSWYAISLFLLLIILVVSIVNTKERIFKVLSILWVSFGVASLFQLIRIFASAFKLDGVSGFFSLGGLFDMPALNTVGTWGDFGMMAGIVAISLAVTLDIVPLKNSIKKVFWFLFGISAFMSAIASSVMLGFGPTQMSGVPSSFVATASIVGIVAFMFVVMQLVKRYKDRENIYIKFPLASLILVFIGIVFLAAPIAINKQINSSIGIPDLSLVNLKPNFTETFNIANSTRDSSWKNSLIGVGPHGFYIARNQFRDVSVNNTDVWNEDFQFGFGYLPTLLINNGVVAFLLWMLSLLILLFVSIKTILKRAGADASINYTNIVTFIPALLLWINAMVNTPGPAVLVLTFVSTGLLIVSLILSGKIKQSNYIFPEGKWNKKICIVATVVFILLMLCLAFLWTERTRAVFYSSKAMQMINAKDANITVVPNAMFLLQKSFNIYHSDVYARAINNLALVQVNYDVSSNQANQSTSSQNTNVQGVQLSPTTFSYLDVAVSSGRESIVANPNDFRNWLQYGSAMQTMALVITDATSSEQYGRVALQSFAQAVDLAKNHPLPLYSVASLYILAGERDYAKVVLEKALMLKPNFQEASDMYQGLKDDISADQDVEAIKAAEIKAASKKAPTVKSTTSKSTTSKTTVNKSKTPVKK